MEAPETPILVDRHIKMHEILESKEYELSIDNDAFILKMELLSNNLISFKINELKNLSSNYYYQEYKYDMLINILLLNNEFYGNISKIYKFCDKAFTKNKVKLIKDKENKIVLFFKNIVDYEEIECKLDIFEIKLTNEEMLKTLFNEIKEIKLKGISNNDINNNNKKERKDLEEKINILIEENKKEKKEFENKINELIEENKKEMKEFEKKINILKEENNKEEKEYENILNLILEENKKEKKE